MKPSGESDQSTPNSAVRDQSVSFDALNVGSMVNSLDADLDSTAAVISAEERAAHQQQLIHDAAKGKRRMVKYAVMGILLLTALGVVVLRHGSGNQALNNQADASQRFPVTSIPLTTLSTKDTSLAVGNAKTLSINGQLNVNNSIVIAPTTQPSGAVTGQLYYNQNSNQLDYYDGKSFQNILAGNDVVTTSLGGATGSLSTGSGLAVSGKTLSNTGVLTVGGASGNIAAGTGVAVKGGAINNTGVLSLQGESGNVTLTAGNGIVVNGTTLSNSGLLSLGGQHGDIAVGTGLAIDNGTLHNTGIISATGAGLITVTNDGNGNITIDGPSGGGAGSGTVASPGGTINKIAKFTGVQTIADSLISDNGTTVTIGGNLSVSGAVTFSAPLTVANGGTGSGTAAGARTNLGAAASGANSDITSLSGLTTALSITQGGTGVGVLPTNGVLIGNGTSPIAGVTTATSGLCLVSTAGAPSFQACPGSGGVASVNSLTGALTIAGVSAGSVTSAGSTITINDATAGTKGLASFNNTNLTVTNGNVNTVQGISTAATPTFGQLTLTSNQAAGTMLTVNNSNAGATGNLLDLQLNGASKLSVSPAGNLTSSGTVNGQTIGNASSFTGGVTVGGALSVNTISPTAALTVGVGGQALTLQGNASTALKATSGANTTTVGFQAPTANVTYNFATATAGNYDICTTVGNCAGVGGGVTTPGGTANTLAKFTGGGTIGNSIITDNGSTVSIGGTLSVNTLTPTGALTVGSSSQNLTLQGAAVSLSDTSAGITNSLVFATPATSNKTITLPNASGTVAVSASGPISLDASGNLTCPTCLTSGGGGGTAGVSSLNGQTGAMTLQGTSAGSITTAGTTITVNDATSGVKGLASFNATNLTVTAGNVNTVQNIAVTSTPTFAGLNLTSALTVGNGGTGAATAAGARTNLGAAGSGANSDITSLSGLTTALSVLQGGTGATSLTANGVLVGNGTSAVTSVTGTNGQCLMVVAGTPAFGACPGGGSSPVSSLDGLTGALTINNSTGSGSAVTINNAAADGATKGIATFNSTNFTALGGVINTVQNINTGASPTFNGLTLSTALTVGNGGTGAATAAGARTNLGAAASGANSDITSLTGLTTALSVSQGGTGLAALTANELMFASSSSAVSQLANGSAGLCLMSNGAASAPSFQTCTGAGGVSSIDGLSGSITLANSSGSLGTITINNAAADGSTKGIAAFNSTNFTAASGVVNTVQGIATTSTPSFAGLTLTTTPLGISSGGTGAGTAAGARTSLGAAASGANSDITSLTGLTTALSVGEGGTGLTTLSADGILYASSTSAISQLGVGTSGQCLISNGAGLAPTWQACPGSGSSGISGTGVSGKLALFNGASSVTSSDVTDTAGSSLSIAAGVSLQAQGTATFEDSSNSATAFQVEDHLANNLLAVDTSGDNINVGANGTTALSSTVNIGTSVSSASQTVTIGSTSNSSSTTIQGGTGGIALSAATGNSISIGTQNSNSITIGKFSSTSPIVFQGSGISQTIQGLTTNPASDIIKTSSNSVTAFQVQNSSGYSVMNVDTSGDVITLGNVTSTAGHGVAGILALADGTSDNRTLSLITPALSTTWTLSLPAIGAASGQCLQSGGGSSTSATNLTFGSCGGAGSTTLQQAYNASAGASPSIDMTSTNKGFTIQNDNASPITGELFGVHDKTASGLGATIFSVANNGDVTANSNETTGSAFTNNANIVSSGNGMVVNANGLTTGNGVKIASTSALQTAGSLLNVSDTATLSTNGGSFSGNLVSVNRSLTANVSGGTSTPTLDTSRETNTSSAGVSTTHHDFFTVGTNANRYLIVGVTDYGCSQPSSFTYGGVALTLIGQNTNNTVGCVFYYGLLAPATGSNDLAYTPSVSSDVFEYVVSSWYNVNQTTPYGSFTTNSSNASSSASLNATSSSGQVVVDFLGGPTTGNGTSAAPSGTLIAYQNSNSVGVTLEGGSSYTVAGGTTTSMSWTSLPASKWSESAIGLNGTPTSASENVTAAVASFSNNCTLTTGTCTDGSSVLSVNQQYSAATGAAMLVQNSGTGVALAVQNGSGTNLLRADTAAGQVLLGQSSNLNGTLAFADSGDASTITIGTNSSGSLNISVPGGTGTDHLGNANFAGSVDDSYDTGKYDCSMFTAAASSTVTSITVWYEHVTSGDLAQAAIYTNSSGNPGTRLAYSNSVALNTTGPWNTFPLANGSAPVTSGTSYWLCTASNGTNPNNDTLIYGNGNATAVYTMTTYGTWPAGPMSSPTYTGNTQYVLYANYASTGSASASFSIGNNGSVTLQNAANSTNAFSVQDAGGSQLFSVDSTNKAVNIDDAQLNVLGLANPQYASFATANSGGTLGNDYYFYAIDALDAAGNTTGSVPALTSGGAQYMQITNGLTTNKNTITWSPVSGAAGYEVWRCMAATNSCTTSESSGAWYFVRVSSGTTSVIDTGSSPTWIASDSNVSGPGPNWWGENSTTGINLASGSTLNFDGGASGSGNATIFFQPSYGLGSGNNSTLMMGDYQSGGSIDLAATDIGYSSIDSDGSWNQDFGANGTGAFVRSGFTNKADAFEVLDTSWNEAIAVNTNNVGGTWNATASTLDVAKNTSTGRSISAAGTINQTGADYAEYFYQLVPGQLQPGDVVCLSASEKVTRCDATNTDLIGVVATNPGLVGNDIFDPANPDATVIVSMIGQVPVRVSDANGAIHTGDMLTLDPATGLAIKATSASMTLGEAEQDFSGGTGTIHIYIHIGYYDPMGLQSDGVSKGYVLQGADATLNNLTVNGTATISTLNVTGSATIASLTVTTALSTTNITINGHIVTAGATPTVVAGATAGSGATVSVTGNDVSGKVTFTLGSSFTAGELVKVTFSQAYGAAPNVVLTAGDGNAAKLQQYVTPTTTSFSVNAATTNGLTNGQTYTFYYHVMQ